MDNLIRGIRVLHQNAIRIEADGRVLYFDPYGVQGAPHDADYIFVTHDQEEALTLSDRIAVFNKGFIEQIGTPNEVYNHSQTEFVCNFIGDINRLNDDTVSALRAAGAEVDASKHNYIRLERLHVNVAPRGGEIALDGTVENCEYYGLYIKYYIHVGTQSLKVIEKNDG